MKPLEDLSIIELKAIILDHIDNINNSNQNIQIARNEIAKRLQNNGQPAEELKPVEVAHQEG